MAATGHQWVSESGEPLPAGAMLLLPWVGLTTSSTSVDTHEAFAWGGHRYLRHWAQLYLGEHDPRDPRASPLFADLSGLPPLSLHVGSVELLYDEVRALAARAEDANVDITMRAWDDMVHAWAMKAPVFPMAEETIADVGDWIATTVDAAQ